MRPVLEMTPAEAARIRFVLFDIDDTIPPYGRLRMRASGSFPSPGGLPAGATSFSANGRFAPSSGKTGRSCCIARAAGGRKRSPTRTPPQMRRPALPPCGMPCSPPCRAAASHGISSAANTTLPSIFARTRRASLFPLRKKSAGYAKRRARMQRSAPST